MFEVVNVDGGPRIKVYAVANGNLTGDIMFLIWDDGEWKWVYASAYGPAVE